MRGALVAASLLALLAPVAGAEAEPGTCRPPVLSVQEVPLPLEPGTTQALLLAIENPNGAPIDAVRATVTTTAPAGWSATPSQRELTMGPHNVTWDTLAVSAPTRGAGAPAGNITLVVTFVCTIGDIQTSASAQRVLEVRIQEFAVAWPLVLGIFLVLTLGVLALGIRRARRGLGVSVDTPDRILEAGKSAKFTLTLENRRGKPQRFHLVASGLPQGWGLHLALTEVDLEPGEEKALWAILKAPPGATPGETATLTLRLEDARAGREGASATVRATVVETA